MGRKVKQLKNYSSSQIKAIIDTDDKYKLGVKLYAVYQLSKGKSSRELEDLYNVSFKQVCNWADRFDAQGPVGLLNKSGGGRRPKMNKKQLDSLKDCLQKSPEFFGYNTSVWTGALVRNFIFTHYRIEYKQSNIYTLLHNMGFSFQRAKGFYPERSESKRQEAIADIKKR
jgi:transposase